MCCHFDSVFVVVLIASPAVILIASPCCRFDSTLQRYQPSFLCLIGERFHSDFNDFFLYHLLYSSIDICPVDFMFSCEVSIGAMTAAVCPFVMIIENIAHKYLLLPRQFMVSTDFDWRECSFFWFSDGFSHSTTPSRLLLHTHF